MLPRARIASAAVRADKLPPRCRKSVLAEVEGLSAERGSKHMGITIETVENHGPGMLLLAQALGSRLNAVTTEPAATIFSEVRACPLRKPRDLSRLAARQDRR